MRQIQVELGDVGPAIELELDGDASRASRERQIGGIAIKREPLDPTMDRGADGRAAARGASAAPRRARRSKGCCADRRAAAEPDEDAAQQREQEESLARIEAGGIPLAAERRLRELGERRRASFTSDLSVDCFALCHQLGLTPLTQVMGSSIYQVRLPGGVWPTTRYGGAAACRARHALRSLERGARPGAPAARRGGARTLGADAVVGVQMRTGEPEFAGGAIE